MAIRCLGSPAFRQALVFGIPHDEKLGFFFFFLLYLCGCHAVGTINNLRVLRVDLGLELRFVGDTPFNGYGFWPP